MSVQPTAPKRDFYGVLSLPRDASPRDIKARFRELARERHPDRFQGEEKRRAEEDFQAITEAFNVLMDPERRRLHDQELDRGVEQQADPSQMARGYINRGVRAYKQGKYLEAANNFNFATEMQPRNAKAWHHLALTCLQEERWLAKAETAIERALELDADNVTYLKLAGKIFAARGAKPRAKGYYERALALGGPDRSIRTALEELGASPGEAKAGKAEPAAKSSRFKLW